MLGVYVAGFLLILVGLMLVSIVHCFQSKALEKAQSRKPLNFTQNDLSLNTKPSCQTCHVCGGLRVRSQNAIVSASPTAPKAHDYHRGRAIARQGTPVQHSWIKSRSQMQLFIKQAFQKLISFHKKQLHGEFLMKLTSWMDSGKQKPDHCFDKFCVPHTSEANFNCSSVTSLASSVEGTDLGSINAGQTNETDKGAVAQGTQQRSIRTDPPDGSFHRVILELLVPQYDQLEESRSVRHPGITLTLQTGATMGHLAGPVDTAKNKETKDLFYDNDATQAQHGSNGSMSKASGIVSTHGDQISQGLDQFGKEPILVLEEMTEFSESSASKFGNAAVDPISDNVSCKNYCQSSVDTKDCRQCHVSGNHAVSGVFNCGTSAIGGSSTHLMHLKLKSRNSSGEFTMPVVPIGHTFEEKGKSVVESMVPVHTVGSLRASFSNLCESEKNAVARQGESLLACLNVTENLASGTNSSNERMSDKEIGHGNLGYCHKTTYIRPLEATGGSVTEKGQYSLQGAMDANLKDDCSSHFKTTKKKRKGRGKKPKTIGDIPQVDARQMQEIGRLALEVAKDVSAVPERDDGCNCRAIKGGPHSDSCSLPLTFSGSMLQRKLQEKYNELVRANAAKTLTLAQVGQFASCLVETKGILKQKSEMIQRKYTIAKSLLSKADKSSFDRLHRQIYGLEMEQKKLEEDTSVYNRLQAQLKLSPAYNKLLDYGQAHFELQSNSGQIIEKLRPEDLEISFEELLEKEKKDSFWQGRHFSRPVLSSR